MGKQSDEEASFRAQKALSSIHDAREEADDALDEMMKAHQRGNEDLQAKREQLFHISVMKLYNRLRPYLHSVPKLAIEHELHTETDENGDPVTQTVTVEEDGEELQKEVPVGIFGLKSLDSWRMLTIETSKQVEKFGKPNETQIGNQPARLPPNIALKAYDGLMEAIVRLNFGADPGEDVMNTHLDDAPDHIKETRKELPDDMKPSTEAPADD